MIMRSLSSVYVGFFSRNMSSHAKVPSSGRLTGKATSYLPSAGAAYAVTLTWALAASCTMWHVNGSGARGVGPKFTCTDAFLKPTCGNKVLPFRLSGRACGCETRLPSLKRLTVLAFSLFSSRFSNTATTLSRPNLRLPTVRFLSWKMAPSESKQMLSAVAPRIREEPAVEKPTLTTFLLILLLLLLPCTTGSATCTSSRTFTSNIYLPLLTPTLARAPAIKC
mmetsp:Transcript_145828/g.467331  ORF Transcript_145828/g.467331 Transcript_145828/m.467331 type:complete len:223 (-) Transcript_145828:357-1025(-)